MIDFENEIYQKCVTALRLVYPSMFITGEYVRAPSSFPCCSIVEQDNRPNERTQDSGSNENYADLLYEINVFSNKVTGKKSECRAIVKILDDVLIGTGFTKTFQNPIPNLEDATIYRIVSRYKGTISKTGTIYRR